MKQFLYYEVVRNQNKLPRADMDAPSTAVLKARLDVALSGLVWGRCAAPGKVRLALVDL